MMNKKILLIVTSLSFLPFSANASGEGEDGWLSWAYKGLTGGYAKKAIPDKDADEEEPTRQTRVIYQTPPLFGYEGRVTLERAVPDKDADEGEVTRRAALKIKTPSGSLEAYREDRRTSSKEARRLAALEEREERRAAAESLFQDGLAYLKGEEVSVNKKAAAKSFKQAVKLGHPKAPRLLGLMYYRGDGVEENKSQAFLLFQKAAELEGHPDALLNLGVMHYNGEGGEEVNIEESHRLFQKAKKYSSDAFFNLGVMYYCDDDKEEAANYFKGAVEKGEDLDAMFNLALMYYWGDGVIEDHDQSKYFTDRAQAKWNAYYRGEEEPDNSPVRQVWKATRHGRQPKKHLQLQLTIKSFSLTGLRSYSFPSVTTSRRAK